MATMLLKECARWGLPLIQIYLNEANFASAPSDSLQALRITARPYATEAEPYCPS